MEQSRVEKAAVAMTKINQIIATDERFGGFFTEDEWKNEKQSKYEILMTGDIFGIGATDGFVRHGNILVFHSREQATLFGILHEDLIKDYFMIGG